MDHIRDFEVRERLGLKDNGEKVRLGMLRWFEHFEIMAGKLLSGIRSPYKVG